MGKPIYQCSMCSRPSAVQRQLYRCPAWPLRSAFTEEFRDAKGFGWTADERPPFDWRLLLKKKAGARVAAFMPGKATCQ